MQGETVGSVEVSYRQEMPASDEGPFPERGGRASSTWWPSTSGSFVSCTASCSTRSRAGRGLSRASRRRRPRGLVGDRRLPAQDRPAPADAGLAPDDQLPLLERHCERPRTFCRASPRGLGSAQPGGWKGENRPVTGERSGAFDSLVKVADRDLSASPPSTSPSCDGEILPRAIQKSIKDDKTSFLVRGGREPGDPPDGDRSGAGPGVLATRPSTTTTCRGPFAQVELRVSLIRRFLTEDIDFLNTAKNYVEVSDFYELSRHIICPPGSHGKLGGKSSGLFLAAQIVKKSLGIRRTHYGPTSRSLARGTSRRTAF